MTQVTYLLCLASNPTSSCHLSQVSNHVMVGLLQTREVRCVVGARELSKERGDGELGGSVSIREMARMRGGSVCSSTKGTTTFSPPVAEHFILLVT
jgi:hypothetical protein